MNGPEIFKQSVVDALKKWKFQPIIIDGRPAKVTGSLNFNFTL
ncbi:MAG: energy transducer TonB [Pyrinomonadaceae bacterium]